jgi:hypothetical protein
VTTREAMTVIANLVNLTGARVAVLGDPGPKSNVPRGTDFDGYVFVRLRRRRPDEQLTLRRVQSVA